MGVSIPNGMEFYLTPTNFSTTPVMFQFPTGWNSTFARIFLTVLILVSIPNGMEFYAQIEASAIIAESFNSQRDGILRCSLNTRLVSTMFQFPTGWNSTKILIEKFLLEFVSIPNGMEFYDMQYCIAVAKSLFQFPTGWNSTELIVRILCKDDRFNSQRDGILQSLAKLRRFA